MNFGNDGVVSKTTTKEKVKSLALKANDTRGQTSSNSIRQDKSDEDEEINLMAKKFRRIFRKGVKKHNKFDKCKEKTKVPKPRIEQGNLIEEHRAVKQKGNEPQNAATCLMAIDSQEVQPKPSFSINNLDFIDLKNENEELLKFNKDFFKTYEKLLQEKCALEKEHSKLTSKVNELKLEVKKLIKSKELIEPCKKCDVFTKEVGAL
ncbi:hypothetical protein Tco_1449045 [Tanacetum coccineum]